jgi:hypothetical protein
MSHYDPGWHKYEPSSEEVLADVRQESRRMKRLRGWRRFIASLPWPLRIVTPVVLGLIVPLAVLAVLFGAAAGRQPTVSATANIRTEGAPVAIDPAFIDFGDFGILEFDNGVRHEARIRLTNLSADAAIAVTAKIENNPGFHFEFFVPGIVIGAGEAREVIFSLSDPPEQSGAYRLDVVLVVARR